MISIGKLNLITDVDGIQVGNSSHSVDLTGVTVIIPSERSVASVDVRGGAPGTREIETLRPENSVNKIDAIVLSGGSIFGLDAASSVTSWLKSNGKGLVVRGNTIPIVPSAIIFDFPIKPDRNWNESNPFNFLGREACKNVTKKFELGNQGAGLGATAGPIKGGLGSASFVNDIGWQVGALTIVNPYGEVVIPGTDKFFAGQVEISDEFGGFGTAKISNTKIDYDLASALGGNTTISVVATNVVLNKPEALRLAIMCQDGIGKAIRPAHTPYDGDVVFVVSTGLLKVNEQPEKLLSRLGTLASDCVSRSIARGVYFAKTLNNYKSYKDFYSK
ncbi:MAG: putative aminopeptidase [Alphaproteobacteria bacterium MarineAlpha2_Bin1]|nr:MAG: putative aminopeptidase [Alphaproteobacteria bacterium MarineAlpha2_Bin1]